MAFDFIPINTKVFNWGGVGGGQEGGQEGTTSARNPCTQGHRLKGEFVQNLRKRPLGKIKGHFR
jgi:hypothetical protein